MMEVVENPMRPDPWFPYSKPNPGAQLRLFCLPPGGASASMFRSWSGLVSNHLDICAVQFPGREGRFAEELIDRMAHLVPAVASALIAKLDLPYVIFGHSLGAWVGFEVTRWLRAAGHKLPIHLFLSAAPAPQHPDLDGHHLLPDGDLIEILHEEMGFPEEVLQSRELMEMMLPVIRADAAVTETHNFTPDTPLDCPITVLIGTHDRKCDPTQIRDWRQHTKREFGEILIEGGHDFLRTAEREVVSAISRAFRG